MFRTSMASWPCSNSPLLITVSKGSADIDGEYEIFSLCDERQYTRRELDAAQLINLDPSVNTYLDAWLFHGGGEGTSEVVPHHCQLQLYDREM